MALDAPLSDRTVHGDGDARELQQRLATFNHARRSASADGLDWLAGLQAEYRMRRLEHDFVESELAPLRPLARDAPRDPERFVAWFERLEQLGPGRGDAVLPFLAEQASAEQLRWFLCQAAVADAGWSDLSQWTQLRFTPRIRPECRFGFYDSDEAAAASAQSLLLERLGCTLAIAQHESSVLSESLALSNLMVALAANRRYAYHSAGALAASEASVAERRAYLRRAVDRLGIHAESYRCQVQEGFDTSRTWGGDALRALVAYEPAAAPRIAEGALLRFSVEARCFERYRSELQQLPLYPSTRPPAIESLPPAPPLHA